MRLLVVEDETRLAAYLKRGLVAEGFAVDIASDGEQGLWLANENAYDAILLDIMLPGIDGYEICNRVRAVDRDQPIIMLTAKTSDEEIVQGLEIDHYSRQKIDASVAELSEERDAVRELGLI